MKRKFTGSATGAFVLFVASGMMASVLGVRQIDRITTTPAWVVNSDLRSGQLITRDAIKQERVNKDLTSGIIEDPRLLVGRKLTVSKKTGDTIKSSDLAIPERLSLSQAVPEGRVLYTLYQTRNSLPFSHLQQGDRLDIVVRGRMGVRTVARNVQLIGIMNSGKSHSNASNNSVMGLLQPGNTNNNRNTETASLVMAVRPGDVYPLASISESDAVSIVLHSAHDIAKGTAQSVGPNINYRDVEIVSGLTRNSVRIHH